MKQFTDWSKAFDYCRELNRPVIVEIVSPAKNPGRYKLFPSGRAEQVTP